MASASDDGNIHIFHSTVYRSATMRCVWERVNKRGIGCVIYRAISCCVTDSSRMIDSHSIPSSSCTQNTYFSLPFLPSKIIFRHYTVTHPFTL